MTLSGPPTTLYPGVGAKVVGQGRSARDAKEAIIV